MSTISFEEALEKLRVPVPEDLKGSEILPEIELMWQTAVVNIQRESGSINQSPGTKPVSELVLLNRFFEFDAGAHQPIFKAVSIDYEACRAYLQKILDPSGAAGKHLPGFIDRLSGAAGTTRDAQLNIMNAHGNVVATSWAVQDDVLSTIIMTAEWDLWGDALRDIAVAFMAHLVVAKLVQAKPGPISFVCNKITLHPEDIDTVNNAVKEYRNLIQFHASIDQRTKLWNAINAVAEPQAEGESNDEFTSRITKMEDNRACAREQMEKLEQSAPLCREMFDLYNQRHLMTLKDFSPETSMRVDLLNLLDLPKISTAELAPVAPI